MFSRRNKTKRFRYARVALTLLLVPLLIAVNSPRLSAAELSNRSVVVGSSRTDATTSHTYRFRINTGITLGSLEVEYCTNSPFVGDVCTAPVGFTLDSATMGTQTGISGLGIHPSTTANKLILGRAPAAITPPDSVVIRINNITNPSTPNETVFVRMSTYASNNGTGIRGDKGTVAFSTTRQVGVSGFVPPYITFCAGVTVNSDCTDIQGNYLNFGEFTVSEAKTTTSQFAVATNDPTGYITTVVGLTLTSGNNIIPALETPTVSIPGVSQFGMNLRANSSPGVGSDKTGVGTGVPATAYNSPNSFSFVAGALARSSVPTEYNVFTASYLANISRNQAAGVYISTITYITTVSF